MRYAQIRSMDVSNGEGIGVSLFTQGCPYHCKGCFNPETWNFEEGKLFTKKQKERILELIQNQYVSRFSVLGGEPLTPQNIVELFLLVQQIKEKKPDLKIWCWTGATIQDILEYPNGTNEKFESLPWTKDTYAVLIKFLAEQVDFLVQGPFIEEEKDLALRFCGSRNQKILTKQEINDIIIKEMEK